MQSEETLLIQFSIKGVICYLSQQETLAMWRRCLARAGIGVSFSEGFNPHPKISLPLPRSVGVEGDGGELLRVNLARQRADRGCFSRPVRTQQAEDGVLRHVE